MDGFSLLKFWRTLSLAGNSTSDRSPRSDDGPFFDLHISKQTIQEEQEEEDEEEGLGVYPGSKDEPDEGSKETIEGDEEGVCLGVSPGSKDEPDEGSKEAGAKSTAKLGVFMLRLKKLRGGECEREKERESGEAEHKAAKEQSKFLTLKVKADEIHSIMSLFNTRWRKHQDREGDSGGSVEALQNYLKRKVRPLYVRLSKRAGSKMEDEKTGEVCEEGGIMKIMGKTKSGGCITSSTRRDDSLLEQQDGIQSAILHCKRSFYSSSSG